MNRRTLLFIGALLLASFLTGGLCLVDGSGLEVAGRFVTRLRSTQTASQPAKPLTLLQVWDVLEDYAAQSDGEPRIASLSSVATVDEPASSGEDGTRRKWQAVLVSSRSELWVTISDGAITQVEEGPVTGGIAPIEGKPQLDSPEALAIARRLRPGLSPETEKGSGWRYVVEQSPTDGGMPSRPVVRVVGSWQGRPAFVELDAASGEIRQAKRQVLAGGGILYSEDAGLTWKASDLAGLFIGDVAADPWQEGGAYAVASKGDQIALYNTQNGGQHWSEVGTLPELATDWPFCLGVAGKDSATKALLVGSSSGLWCSSDGRTWRPVAGLPKGAARWLAVARSGREYRVIISILGGDGRGLYSSTDLSTWERVAEVPYRLSESYDHTLVMASDDLGSQPLLLSLSSQRPVELPPGVLRAAGDFEGSFAIFVWPEGRVGRVSPGEDVAWTLDALFGSMAAAPDFPASNTILAARFRGGIYRSTDGGHSWKQVLADPSSVVPGTNEVQVRFLSPRNAVAVTGGVLAWTDF